MIDLKEICSSVVTLVELVGEFIIEERINFSSTKIEYKGLHDLVSYVDKESEIKLVNGLRAIMPSAGFITEENTANKTNEEYVWIIDPLDGTTNFIHNVTPHAISIALAKNNQVVLGVVYELGKKEMFKSCLGDLVYCNNISVNVSQEKSLNNSLIAVGMPINNFTRLDNHLSAVKQVIENSHGIRRYGSAAVDLAYVACGRFEGFFEYGLSSWDVAAGSFLVSQAGGNVSDYNGSSNFLFGEEILVGTPQIHAELLQIIKKLM